MKLPSDESIKELGTTGDVLRYAVVGFSAIEATLEALIAEALPSPHPVELRRLSFKFKVDLAIGLGSLQKESKSLLVYLSKIRNYYAHEFAPGEDYCSAEYLASHFSNAHRALAGEHLDKTRSFTGALRVAFIVAYYDIKGSIERLRKHKEQRKEAFLHAKAVLSIASPLNAEDYKDPAFISAYEKLEEQVRRAKDELKKQEGDNSDAT